MNLLFSNDKTGKYPDSWYAATANTLPPFAPLRGETRADVCVVGAGYTGLSAALHLAKAGLDVVVVEAHRAGFGASGLTAFVSAVRMVTVVHFRPFLSSSARSGL